MIASEAASAIVRDCSDAGEPEAAIIGEHTDAEIDSPFAHEDTFVDTEPTSDDATSMREVEDLEQMLRSIEGEVCSLENEVRLLENELASTRRALREAVTRAEDAENRARLLEVELEAERWLKR